MAGHIGAYLVQERAQALETACQADTSRARLEALLAEMVAQLEPVLCGLQALDPPAESAATATEAMALDRPALEALLLRMQALLEAGDTEVSDWLAELSALVRGSPVADALPPLQQAIDEYAFDDALTQVQRLRAAMSMKF
ncbi:hypothetical protein SAMN05421644_10890 [Allochromatium warmingii]|uniref:Uncharacterized protein n=1 Tax=Allochromatium warmingii TaxID=61595 RepID=A0A1H3DEI6_ALLWA|nr:hypothetical protein [Allochromatium warmingii]SDX64767.1 hypothetical protein SAMN05421644_10890 [Allochromatium warmingii]